MKILTTALLLTICINIYSQRKIGDLILLKKVISYEDFGGKRKEKKLPKYANLEIRDSLIIINFGNGTSIVNKKVNLHGLTIYQNLEETGELGRYYSIGINKNHITFFDEYDRKYFKYTYKN